MIHIWKLIIIEHWRKKYIFGLAIVLLLVALCIPLINSLTLGQGDIVNHYFQHVIIEIVGLLFLVYFGSTIFYQFQSNKTLQLLRSKKKQPLGFIAGVWLGLYSVFAFFVISALILSLLWYHDILIIATYLNILISGAIALSTVLLLSFLINSYATMLSALVLYVISYSINYIIFSTPVNFESNFSFKILTIVQYLFPRFDILYSTIGSASWGWAVLANSIYFICISIIMIRVFLSRFS